MPKRTDISSVMVIGSGPIVIGQACEFDYSGTQACRVLRDEGMRVILVNSNPATIMTDPEMADATYVEPLTTDTLEKIIAHERPDALLPTLGGQTALNVAVDLADSGVLEKYGVELIGASINAIKAGEDRDRFKGVVEECGASSARSIICHSLTECMAAAEDLGYPVVVRPSFTMGGLGSGFAHTPADLRRIAGQGLELSPTTEVLLEESILGWKEFELEVMRDQADNSVVVCSIENVDPVGVHTGDSITVAPALTLTDREYQRLRDIGIAIVRKVGVDTGGCNIQFAVHPETGRVIVIEMNPRVSRSSALASKATGFPIAKIAARLALGYTLDEIDNDITGSTPASFEPAIDYVVVKVPRFAFEKFPGADPQLTTTMKSVGEAMAIGRTFPEALGKALRSIDKTEMDFVWHDDAADADGPASSGDKKSRSERLASLAIPTEKRIIEVQRALYEGYTIDEIYQATKIDRWFLGQIAVMNEVARSVKHADHLDGPTLMRAKRHGLSDRNIAALRGLSEATVREVRYAYGIHPTYKTVDTCAGEFAASTPYYYSTYELISEVCEREREAVVILGSGPNRIGQGIEFDYSCVHATMALAEHYETVMINCNPETVSTDYDISDRLYFEPLTLEDVLEVWYAENGAGPLKGMIVQLGGQTPLSLASDLQASGIPILGTSPDAIDAAEDRERFGQVLATAGLSAPAYGTAMSPEQAKEVARDIGYPVLARPSYVLGGRGMQIIYSEQEMDEYLARDDIRLTDASRRPAPLLIDRFLDDATEIDVDALYDGAELYLAGVMEHIEEAGIHSGDSACILPPLTLSQSMLARIREATEAIAAGVGVRGLINIQFALLHDTLYVIEANPRASRSVPFVAKATGLAIARLAALIMTGQSIAELREAGMVPHKDALDFPVAWPTAVKEAVLPFERFTTREGQVVDSLLGPEMRSTGEVMGMGETFPIAFAKSQRAAYGGLPSSGTVFVSVGDRDKGGVFHPVSQLVDLGFTVLSTSGTADVLRRYGITSTVVRKESEGRGPDDEPTVVDLIRSGEIDMVLNTPNHQGARRDGYSIRAAATAAGIPIVTTTEEFAAAAAAIKTRMEDGEFTVCSLQDYDAARWPAPDVTEEN